MMLGSKSVKGLHPLMSPRQALRKLSSASRFPGFEHPSTRHRYSYFFKKKAHRVTKVGEFGYKNGKVRTENRRIAPA